MFRKIYKDKYGPGTLLILLVLAALFAFVKISGSEIHSEIATELSLAKKFENEANYQKAHEHLSNAINKFGFIYSIHVTTMREGDKYFSKDWIKGLKVQAQLGQISMEMCDGNTDVEKRLEQAQKYLEHIKNKTANPKFNKLYELNIKSINSLKTILPAVKLYSTSNLTQAKEQLSKFMEKKDYDSPNAIFAALSIYYKIAKKTKLPHDVLKVAELTSIFAEVFNNDIHKELADKAVSLQKEVFPNAKAPDSLIQEKDNKVSEELSVNEKYELALTLAKMGELEEAKNLLELCNKEKPENNQICYLLALIYNKLGLEHEAKLLCKEILKRQPNHEKTKKLLNKLRF